MKKIICILFLFAGLKSGAQTFERGFGFQFYYMPGDVLITSQNNNYSGPITYKKHVFAILPVFELHASVNFPILDRPGYAFGIQPGILVNGMLRIDGLFLGTREDLHLTWRTGGNASYANYVVSKRYFGVGVGPSLYTISNYIDEVYSDKILFVRPSLALSTGVDNHSFKVFFQLLPYSSFYRGFAGNIPKIKYWQVGISWEKWGFIGGND